jgi:hypothetical protein
MLQEALREMGIITETRGQFGLMRSLEKRARREVAAGRAEHEVVILMINEYKKHQVEA